MNPVDTDWQKETDEELMRHLANGRSQAFDEIYARYGQKLFGYFYKMLWKEQQIAEDQTQELFLKLINNAEKFQQGRSLSTWMYSIAHNMCKNEYRKQEVRQKFSNMNPKKEQTISASNPDMRRFRIAVNDVVSALDEDKRSLFLLRFEEELSVPEISSILNLPEGTVKSRIFYLLREMKTQLIQFKSLPIYP